MSSSNTGSFPANLTLTALRVVAAFIFFTSGTIKVFAWPIPMPDGATFDPMTQIGIGGILEVVGGVLLFLGLFTRITAFLMSGMMAVAYFQFHAPGNFHPVVNQGTAAVLFCFIWLHFAAAGAGPWSLDARRGKKK